MALRLTIQFETAPHHGSGFGLAGVVDRALIRDASGMPYLAGSAIKGKFRWAALRLLRAGLHTGTWCGPPAKEYCKAEPWCMLCQVFGSPMTAGTAIFHDAYPAAEEAALLRELVRTSASPLLSGSSDVRATTAIDRQRRTVMPQHLFTTETLVRSIRFESEIGGRLSREQAELLKDCAKTMTHFGGDSTRGLGFCHYALREDEP